MSEVYAVQHERALCVAYEMNILDFITEALGSKSIDVNIDITVEKGSNLNFGVDWVGLSFQRIMVQNLLTRIIREIGLPIF